MESGEIYTKVKGDGSYKYLYAVVQFLEQPYDDIDDYVCVPHSWIHARRPTDRRTMVAFPKDEPPSMTRLRIMNCEKPLELWKRYMAIIKWETDSCADACEYIMEKLHNASTSIHSFVMSNEHELAPAPPVKVPRRHSPVPKTTKEDTQLKSNERKRKVLDDATLVNTMTSSSKSPEHPNFESRTTSTDLRDHVSPKNIVIKKTGREKRREHHEQIPHDVVPSLSDPRLEQTPNNGTQVNAPTVESQNIARKTLHASRSPLNFVYEFCGIPDQQQDEELSMYREHLNQIALTHGIQNKVFPNLRTFHLDIPEPLCWDSDFGSNTSFVNEAHQSSQLEVPKSAPVNQDHPQVSPTATKSSEVVCAVPKPNYHSTMMNAPSSVTCYDSPEYQGSTMEEMVADGFPVASCIEENVFSGVGTNNESTADPSSLNNANHSDQSVESSEEPPVIELVTSSDASSDDDYDDDDDDDDERSSSPEISQEEVLTATSNSNKQENQSVESVLNKADVWADQLVDIFQRMKVEFSATCEISHDLHKSLLQTNKVVERIANAAEMFRKNKNNKYTLASSKDVSVEIQQMAKENSAEKKQEENRNVNMVEDRDVDSERSDDDNDDSDFVVDDDDDADVDGDDNDVVDDVDNDGKIKDITDKDNKVPKTTRGCISSFVLPPEYDPDDTRWTLKYRENDPNLNLVELVPKSNVFVEFIKLAHCKRISKDYKDLARKLLEEVFTQSALSVCSLTGVRANAFDISGTNVRPGLDQSARMAILIFTEKYGREKKWGAFDQQSVICSMRSKIQHVRKLFNRAHSAQ